ncbi:hypothetical protein HHK36_025565 [Tetracentron sinense]|uniref:Profilin n=1 Tax=Tetracentron sinense TaxID=13715 RepID=A0A834YHR8_TETSI|nr:hypothetical protein HHK36_025565 [Tetracentron sinense]
MSWQTYVDDHLMCDIEGNHLTAAAIIGHDGSVWAQSVTFPQVSSSLEDVFSLLCLKIFGEHIITAVNPKNSSTLGLVKDLEAAIKASMTKIVFCDDLFGKLKRANFSG